MAGNDLADIKPAGALVEESLPGLAVSSSAALARQRGGCRGTGRDGALPATRRAPRWTRRGAAPVNAVVHDTEDAIRAVKKRRA